LLNSFFLKCADDRARASRNERIFPAHLRATGFISRGQRRRRRCWIVYAYMGNSIIMRFSALSLNYYLSSHSYPKVD
jgi:hypothetical protein